MAGSDGAEDGDGWLLSFQHCRPGCSVTCLRRLPAACPLCRRPMAGLTLASPPFRIPSPFASSASRPFSMVITPSSGTFLGDYLRHPQPANLGLHVGLTDSSGRHVHHYNEAGLHCDRRAWPQSLPIPLLTDRDVEMRSAWDHLLQRFTSAHSSAWTRAAYDQGAHNCYDFVLHFLKSIDFFGGQHLPADSAAGWSREEFCKVYIVPATTRAAQYIDLYRGVVQKGFSINSNFHY